ncbi:MAG: peptidoglycan-binding domain-containing protein [Bacteroidota bacterium]
MEQTIDKQQSPQKGNGKKILLIGLSVAATGTLGYFGYQWWRSKTDSKGRDENDSENPPELDLTPPSKSSFSIPSAPKRNDEFPLKKGSKGARVKQLQDALIEKHGKQILPKYGADGDFGSETTAALTKVNLPVVMDESTFNVIVQGGGLNPASIAGELYSAAVKKDFTTLNTSLSKLKSKEDYSAVGDIFKTRYTINGVRQTLVNGLLNSFTDEKQKQAIRLHFSRMGLNYDGNKWSLSGLDTQSLITVETATVWVTPVKAIKVPPKTVLGREVCKRHDHTMFENNGAYYLVLTKTINYL